MYVENIMVFPYRSNAIALRAVVLLLRVALTTTYTLDIHSIYISLEDGTWLGVNMSIS